MKKYIYLILILLLNTHLAKSQWDMQGLGYELGNLRSRTISIIDENTVWTGVTYNSSEPCYSRTQDGGINWIPGTIPGYSGYEILRLKAINDSIAWMILKNSAQHTILIKTINSGQSWIEQMNADSLGSSLSNVFFWDAYQGFLLGGKQNGYYGFYTSNDGGNNWIRVDSSNIPAPWSSQIESIYGWTISVIDSNIFLPTNLGRIYKSADKGHHWSVMNTPYCYTNNIYYLAYFEDVNHGIIRKYENNGDFYETYNGGQSWTLVNPTGNFYCIDLTWVPGMSNTCVSVGYGGLFSGCSVSFDGGHSWTDFDELLGTYLFSSAWFNESCGWVTSETETVSPASSGIYKYTGTLVSISEPYNEKGDLLMSPNPVVDRAKIHFSCFEEEKVSLQLYSLQGQCVYQSEFFQDQAQSDHVLDIGFLPPGSYLAKVSSSGKYFVQKICKL